MKIQTERLVVGGVALLVGLAIGWMVRGVATYNTHAGTIADYDDWRVTCPSAQVAQGVCELSSDILDAGTQAPLARVTITKDTRDGGKPVIGFVLPYGVALQANMGLTIGKDPIKVLNFRTCNSVGCVVLADFDDKMSSALKENQEARIAFVMADGRQAAAPVSFKGYNTAMSSYKALDARRNSWFWRLFS